MKRLGFLAAVALFALAFPALQPVGAAASGPCNGVSGQHITHVVWIVLENRSYGEVVGHVPALDDLRCGVASNMHNISHPSLPNYITMTSGISAAQAPKTDCPTFCPVNAPSIFGQGPSWNVFAESMPKPCDRSDARPYVTHHTAAPYYTYLVHCPTQDLPLTAFDPTNLANFTMIVPNVAHDMHQGSSSVAAGDAWLASFLPGLDGSPEYLNGSTVVFVTWDEGGVAGRTTKNCATNTTDQGCHIPFYVLAESVTPGMSSGVLFNHYSLLRTTEELLGYPLLGLANNYPSLRALVGA
jgi:hypothetical protein